MEIKPCPFCGGAPSQPTSDQTEYNSYDASIFCSDCDAVVSLLYTEPSPDDAIRRVVEIWNRRASTDTKEKGDADQA